MPHLATRIGRLFLPGMGFALLLVLGCTNSNRPIVEQSIVAPPEVPPALHRTPSLVKVHLDAKEVVKEIAPGVTYNLWTFNQTVPGPMLRVHEGDRVEITLSNDSSSTVAHNIDLHSVNGPGGGAGATTVAPGETKSFTFKAEASGLFTYHCAAGVVADHITNGMYGAILVEPREGLPVVDHEYYVGQSDIYTSGENGATGKQDLDMTKLLAEQPTYVLFNGHSKSLLGDNALKAKVGDTVRIYFVDGGPNLTSSFHVIGEIFDKAWAWGTLESSPIEGVQTISVPPGGATIVQFKVTVPGDYKLVDHAIGRVSKGAVGTLQVTGKANPDVFSVAGSPDNVAASSGHDMAPDPALEVISSGTIKVTMKDNVFDPKKIAVKAGSSLMFETPNVGKVPHNLRIAPLDGNFDSPQSVVTVPEIVSGGKTGMIEWKVPTATGTYKFRCDIHPVEMTGTITVQ